MTEKTKILLIRVDQLTPLLMGKYGHKVAQTPNIDALAKEGVRFDAAYTPCRVCSPARAKMETWRRDYNEVRPHSAIRYNVPIALQNPGGAICRSS